MAEAIASGERGRKKEVQLKAIELQCRAMGDCVKNFIRETDEKLKGCEEDVRRAEDARRRPRTGLDAGEKRGTAAERGDGEAVGRSAGSKARGRGRGSEVEGGAGEGAGGDEEEGGGGATA
eukprot:3067552-Rhodomonas_salina.1